MKTPSDDLKPVYLFAQPDGAVFFSDAGFSGFIPIQDARHRPVKTASHPHLVLPTSFSKVPGARVRYIDQGKRFAYARIP